MDDKIYQKIVMDEELVQNGVTDGKFVENIVMNSKIGPYFVMDPSMFTSGGRNTLQPSNQELLEQIFDENEPWLFFGIPNRYPFLGHSTWNGTL